MKLLPTNACLSQWSETNAAGLAMNLDHTELDFLAPLNLENQEAYQPFHAHLWPNKVEYNGISVEFQQPFEVSTSSWMQWIFLFL